MLEISEADYAMKFAVLIILDERRVSGMDKYMENFKYMMESYSAHLKKNHTLVIPEEDTKTDPEEEKRQVVLLTDVCKLGNIGLILRQSEQGRQKLFSLFVDAISRALILVHYYAPDGELLAKILKEYYCGWREQSDEQLCRYFHISRSSLYRKRQQGLMYAGYLFYEAVLPDMAGAI